MAFPPDNPLSWSRRSAQETPLPPVNTDPGVSPPLCGEMPSTREAERTTQDGISTSFPYFTLQENGFPTGYIPDGQVSSFPGLSSWWNPAGTDAMQWPTLGTTQPDMCPEYRPDGMPLNSAGLSWRGRTDSRNNAHFNVQNDAHYIGSRGPSVAQHSVK